MGHNMKQDKPVDFKSTANLTDNTGFQSTLSITSKDVTNEKIYNPFEHRQVEHPNSTFGSVLHLLKACIGTGILAMPSAFKNAGIIAGIIGTLLAGIICTHTIDILVKISQKLSVEAKKPSMSFSETCGAAFTYGPARLRPWGNFVKILIDYSLVLTYFSTLCVYVVFIGSSFKEVLDVYLPEYDISIQAYCALTLVPLVLISQIRNLKYLVPFSAVANALIVIVFLITLYYMFFDLPPVSDREMVANVSTWPLFISTVIFAMEGIGVVLPIENEMAHPQKFLGCPGVLNISMVIIISLFGVFGFFGYLKYGNDVKGSITLNLPQDELVAQSAKLFMGIVIYFSYALQMYVPMEIIQRFLQTHNWNKCENLMQISIRTVLVILTVIIAALFPNLELVISFVGAVFFSTLGLFIPAAIDIIYCWNKSLGRFNYVLYKDIIIIIIALIALVSGSYISIHEMIQSKQVVSKQNITLT